MFSRIARQRLTPALHCRALSLYSSSFRSQSRLFSSLPNHLVVGMPALSPTMETGSIAKWLLKEGDEFKPGTAICEVETDKAVVTYDATEDGVLAKILVDKGEITVGQPIMITVENVEDVKAFSSYTQSASPAAPSAPSSAPSSVQSTPTLSPSPSSSVPSSAPVSLDGRLFASPLARTLARDASLDLSLLPSKGYASGPNGRIIADDVRNALSAGINKTVAASVVTPSVSIAPPPSPPAPSVSEAISSGSLSDLFTQSKRTVPHYYLSVDIDLSAIQSLRSQLNSHLKSGSDGKKESETISVQDLLLKAAARAMEKVPEVNSSWRESFVRRYENVDINLMVGRDGDKERAPLLRDVGRLGLTAISKTVNSLTTNPSEELTVGTFSVHNLGIYGVKGAAPIVLPPQACALGFGSIADTVVPNPKPDQDGQKWMIVPMMTVTLSSDHRVVDGAVGAAWLSAFKEYAQNPLTLLL